MTDFISSFLCHILRAPKRRENVDSTRSTADSSRLLSPPPQRHHLLFDCCVFYLIGGRLSPGPQPSLYFAMGCVSSPKAAPTARMNTNRACPTFSKMFRACASRRVGRQTAMGGCRGGGGRRQCWGKNRFNAHRYKNRQNSPPLVKQKKPSAQSIAHNVASMRHVLEWAVDSHGRR